MPTIDDFMDEIHALRERNESQADEIERLEDRIAELESIVMKDDIEFIDIDAPRSLLMHCAKENESKENESLADEIERLEDRIAELESIVMKDDIEFIDIDD